MVKGNDRISLVLSVVDFVSLQIWESSCCLQLVELMKISSPFVQHLEIRQLLPQPVDQTVAVEDEEGDS